MYSFLLPNLNYIRSILGNAISYLVTLPRLNLYQKKKERKKGILVTLSYVQVPWLVVLDQIDLLVMVTGLLTLTLT